MPEPCSNAPAWLESLGLSDCNVFGVNYVDCIDRYGNFAYTFYDIVSLGNMPPSWEWYQYCFDYHNPDPNDPEDTKDWEKYKQMQSIFNLPQYLSTQIGKFLPLLVVAAVVIWRL